MASKGGVSRRRSDDDGGGDGGDGLGNSNVDDGCTSLPDDMLSAVFVRLSDPAAVVRAAATCRRWGRVVAKDAAVISRTLLRPCPHLLLGFFHQDGAGVTARKRKRECSAAARLCFVPTMEPSRASRRVVLGLHRALPDAVAEESLGYSRPVASRNGRLVLELAREGHSDGLTLCVCNPLTGEMALLPPLTGDDKPGFYVCALLGGGDDDDADLDRGRPPPRRPLSSSSSTTTFFRRLLIVYNRHGFTALRSYSPETGRWSSVVRRPKISRRNLRDMGQGAVLRGVAYWPLVRNALTVLAVRVDTPEPAEVRMPADGLPLILAESRDHNSCLLGVAVDDDEEKRLTFVWEELEIAHDDYYYLHVNWKFFRAPTAIDDDMSSGEWERAHVNIRLTEFKLRRTAPTVNLRWLCENSGILLLTLGQYSSDPGAFSLNLTTGEVVKVVHGAHCDSWKNLVGYEMESTAAYLASIAGYYRPVAELERDHTRLKYFS